MTLLATLRGGLERLIRPLLLVCVLMLAVGPGIDGFTCGLEPANAEAASVTIAHDDGPGAGDPVDHAVCGHGHCHHPSRLAGDDSAPTPVVYATAELTPPLAMLPPSASLPAPKRPPRA